jgi:two-component system, OmpR family, response regulator
VRLLVVEDESRLAASLRTGLEAEGFAVDIAPDGAEGLWYAREHDYDAILLDLMLPVLDGYSVCTTLRKEGNWTPILMLTAKDADRDQVEGLDSGADDYVVKPFSPVEVVARVKAVMRRMSAPPDPHRVLRAGPATLEPASRRVTLDDGREVELTRLEFDLLAELAAHPRVVYTRERLLEKVWGYQSAVGGKTVDVHVANLRRKLGDGIGIVAVRGVGYRLEPAA